MKLTKDKIQILPKSKVRDFSRFLATSFNDEMTICLLWTGMNGFSGDKMILIKYFVPFIKGLIVFLIDMHHLKLYHASKQNVSLNLR